MVLVTSLSGKFNKLIATPLLRYGLSARYRLGGGVLRDNNFLDTVLLMPLAQALISIEVSQEQKELLIKKKRTWFDDWVDKIWDQLHLDRLSMTIDEKNGHKKNDPPRLQSLEAYLRPTLVPNERWSDVERWRFHTRFMHWARKEFLIAKYGESVKEALQCYPKLRQAAMLTQSSSWVKQTLFFSKVSNVTQDKLILPSIDILQRALGIRSQQTKNFKNAITEKESIDQIARSMGGRTVSIHTCLHVATDIHPETETSHLSLEDILEVAGGQVKNRGPFHVLCEEANIYEFWTKDYVDKLAKYLIDRCENDERETLILEIGAGDGLLSHFLKEYMNQIVQRPEKHKTKRLKRRKEKYSGKLPQIIATDDGSWKINSKTATHVEQLNVEQSLSKYCHNADPSETQLIVISSWMPNGQDWTASMRAANVDEYILIGECDDGACGDNWFTWGNPYFHPDNDSIEENNTSKDVTPPYELDGYERCNLEALSRLQFSRFDSNFSSTSKTVSFRLKT